MIRVGALLLCAASAFGQAVALVGNAAVNSDTCVPVWSDSNKTFVCSTNPGLGATGCLTISVANQSPTGTTTNKLTKIVNDPPVAQITGTSDVNLGVGIVKSGGGTTGSAVICLMGTADCVFDNATVASHYVTASNSVAGDCHDAGATQPTDVVYYGTVKETGVAGTRTIFLNTPDTLSGIKNNINNGHTSKQNAADQVEVSDSNTATTWQTLCGGSKPLVFDTSTNTFSCPTVPLAAGGTNATSLTTPGNCIKLNDAGTALETSSQPCAGSSGTVGGFFGGQIASSVANGALGFGGNIGTANLRASLPADALLTGPTFCLIAAPVGFEFLSFVGSAGQSAGVTLVTSTNPSLITNDNSIGCYGQEKSLFNLTSGEILGGNFDTTIAANIGAVWTTQIRGSALQPLFFGTSGTIALSANVFIGPGQGATGGLTTTDEQLEQLPLPDSYTLTDICVTQSTNNGAGGSATYTTRKNASSAGGLVVTKNASVGIGRNCTTGSVAYTAGDKIAVNMVDNNGAAATGTLNNIVVSGTVGGTNQVGIIYFPKGQRAIAPSQIRYTPMWSNEALTAGETTQWGGLPYSGVLKNLYCYQKTAPGTTTTTMTVWVNGSATTLQAAGTVAAGNDVNVSDTTHSWAYTKNQPITLEWISGSGVVGVWSGCMLGVYSS